MDETNADSRGVIAMRVRRLLLAALLVLSVTRDLLFAEVPPLSQDKLESAAKLIVTGTVTKVDVSKAMDRVDGKEYTYDLTLQVEAVLKGKFERGETLVARGSFIDLKRGLVGGAGHYFDNTQGRMTHIEPGWELTLHLAESKDGAFGILYPNGLAVIARPAKAVDATWLVCAAVAMCVAFLLMIVIRRRRPIAAEPDSAPEDGSPGR